MMFLFPGPILIIICTFLVVRWCIMKPPRKTGYDDPASCNNCGKMSNMVDDQDYIQGRMSEAKTHCIECGFDDYWTYGKFNSGADGYNNSRKY